MRSIPVPEASNCRPHSFSVARYRAKSASDNELSSFARGIASASHSVPNTMRRSGSGAAESASHCVSARVPGVQSKHLRRRLNHCLAKGIELRAAVNGDERSQNRARSPERIGWRKRRAHVRASRIQRVQ